MPFRRGPTTGAPRGRYHDAVRIAVVSGICVERDAISTAAAAQCRALASLSSVDRVDLFSGVIDRKVDVDGHLVTDGWQLAQHPRFVAADVAVFHWGIHYPAFDALTLRRPGMHQVIHFHNLTPEHLVADQMRAKIRQSEVQLSYALGLGLPVWTFSEENRQVLRRHGVADERISFVPFAIDPPRPLVASRPADAIQLVTIGRITAAKGTDVLVEAMREVVDQASIPVRLDLVTNVSFADHPFFASVIRRIDELDLGGHITVSDRVDDAELWGRLERSHVIVCPSLHEGLCVPVLEGYLAGCRVVAARSGNLRHIVAPPDLLAEPGDPRSLAAAISIVVEELRSGVELPRPLTPSLTELYSTDSERRFLAEALTALVHPLPHQSPWPLDALTDQHSGLIAST